MSDPPPSVLGSMCSDDYLNCQLIHSFGFARRLSYIVFSFLVARDSSLVARRSSLVTGNNLFIHSFHHNVIYIYCVPIHPLMN